MSSPAELASGLAEMMLSHGWELDQHGNYFNPSSMERTDFAGALNRTIQTQVEAELRKRRGG